MPPNRSQALVAVGKSASADAPRPGPQDARCMTGTTQSDAWHFRAGIPADVPISSCPPYIRTRSTRSEVRG